MPWLVNWEQVFTRDLFGGDDTEFFAEFMVDGLLRGDMATRAEANEKARLGGWKSANEIRLEDNRLPLPGDQGNRYLEPLNMRAVSDPMSAHEDNDEERENRDNA